MIIGFANKTMTNKKVVRTNQMKQ